MVSNADAEPSGGGDCATGVWAMRPSVVGWGEKGGSKKAGSGSGMIETRLGGNG